MRVVALVSGGKDSTYSIVECISLGHEVVCLANLAPTPGLDELDSFMFQTVGHHAVDTLAEAMQLPLLRNTISRKCTVGDLIYDPRPTDEVEDMFDVISLAKEKFKVDAVCSGAIASTYQRTRVESVCARLGLVSLAYLWKRDQVELLHEMPHRGLDAMLIKISGIGLTVENHLGKTLQSISADLLKFHKSFGINPCGEGGEYETFTLDATCFKKKITIDEQSVIEVDRNDTSLNIFDDMLSEADNSLRDVGSRLDNSFCVYLYIPRMTQFAELNKIYQKHFAKCLCPPARSCVESSSKDLISVYIVSKWTACLSDDRRLYVRSISHWAPANIGPYSQYVSFEGVTFVSGQIPMVPATLNVLHSAKFADHAILALNHAKSVLKELKQSFTFIPRHLEDPETGEDIKECDLYCVCYVTSEKFFRTVREIWEHLKLPNQNLIIVQIPVLPKNASVEWEFVHIDHELNSNVVIKVDTFDNVNKFLENFEAPGSELKPCRVFMDAETLSGLIDNETLETMLKRSSVCLIPVAKVYNGSIAVCGFAQI
ncbi:uncharacterized protein LOC134846102 isoform X3 [Symsagittifera roscoffensis]|uniref:uncharacterized protein LOC134846102 isoform X3 n=1 Tax=Symsagittifera roscoffensis TaxID=84072 RepID=UPI00307C1E64